MKCNFVRVKRLIETLGHPKRVAEMLGISYSYMRCLLCGNRNIPVKLVKKLVWLSENMDPEELRPDVYVFPSKQKSDKVTPDVSRLERVLSEYLGAQVNIRQSSNKGSLTISYHNLDELDGILQKIGWEFES